MTWANRITILRILAVPFFIVALLEYFDRGEEIFRLAAILTFALAAFSDGVDGYIARHYGQRSELGAILDPLADKLLLVAGVVLLSIGHDGVLHQLPLWLVAIILSRDVLLLLGLAVIHYVLGRVPVRPHWTGKLATVFQMALVLWTLLKWPAPGWNGMVWSAGIFTAVSGLIYIREGIRQLSQSPHSAPSPPAGSQAPKP